MRKVLWTVGAVFCLVNLAGLFLIAKNRLDDAMRAATCQGSLSFIATAMHNYHEKYGRFPPAYLADATGKPIHSWRVLLLEFMDPPLYAAYKFNEPWDGPNNQKIESHIGSLYSCPADPEGKANWRTNYFVVIGDRTLFPGSRALGEMDVEKPNSSVILVVESIGQDVRWMEPKDLSFDFMSFTPDDSSKPSVSSRHNGPSVCMIDGEKWRLISVPEQILKEMFLIKPSGRE